jgi:hypothetical protein
MEGQRESGDARDLIQRRQLGIHARQVGLRARAKSRVRIRLEAASFPNLHRARKPFRNSNFSRDRAAKSKNLNR